MVNILKFSLFFLCVSLSVVNAQQRFTLSGTIIEESSNETLIGVSIVFPEIKTGTTTNEYGFYSITLPKGVYKIEISYLGFSTITETITLSQNISKNFSLKDSLESLDEIIITKSSEKANIRSTQMSINKLSSAAIKEIPILLGEPDIIKAITLLPGVSNAGEASSGFNVRGGAVDQNLILLDEATLYNSSHLFGLFSIFNTDAIKDIKLYKGGIPARYGGRVASVLDIYQKEGNSKKFHGSGGIGLVTSRLLFEGPLKKNVSSFLISGRSSYAHLFLPLFDVSNKAYFYDINTKLSYRINDENNIYLSGYFGRDVFSVNNTFENIYGNSVLNFRWNHLFSDKLFSNLSMIYSDYTFGLNLDFIEFEWTSGIQSLNIKYDFKHYTSDKIKLQYGLNSYYYKFTPGDIKPNTETSGINEMLLTNKYALENAIYIDTEHKVTEKLALSYGLRVSSFFRLGQDEFNIYENDQPVIWNNTFKVYEKAEPIDNKSSERTDILEKFFNLEPRAALSYRFNENNSIKLSYNRMSQYLHLLSNTSSPTPLDIWAPSGKYIKPQLLDQYAAGYFINFSADTYSIELESFYKTIKNRIDYVDGADLIANNYIERAILNGRARAYGLEFLFRKNKGRFKGWIAYTLSKSEQQTEGRTPDEFGINNGSWYYTPYDKTHDVSVTTSFKLSNSWKINTNFLFQTGQPVTFPNSQYLFNGIVIPNYSGRNEDRLPSYHRLDLAINYTPKTHKNQSFRSSWDFGIYNVYNRRNASSIDFNRNRGTGRNEAKRLSIFGIVPSISYNFKF
ncbi:TonB-dependent receptor [Algibacter sp. 2305UL17-15]|uniref:TonB-dependent receptor n=1 Tax=Algibacter sp. 2305UL17-15 TaxID=3231268 RepID=UPI003459630E